MRGDNEYKAPGRGFGAKQPSDMLPFSPLLHPQSHQNEGEKSVIDLEPPTFLETRAPQTREETGEGNVTLPGFKDVFVTEKKRMIVTHFLLPPAVSTRLI